MCTINCSGGCQECDPQAHDLSPPVIHGKLIGMDITTRRPYTASDGTVYSTAPLITMVVEDDEAWHRKDFQFDASWLDDLILCAQLAKEHIKRSG